MTADSWYHTAYKTSEAYMQAQYDYRDMLNSQVEQNYDLLLLSGSQRLENFGTWMTSYTKDKEGNKIYNTNPDGSQVTWFDNGNNVFSQYNGSGEFGDWAWRSKFEISASSDFGLDINASAADELFLLGLGLSSEASEWALGGVQKSNMAVMAAARTS